MSLDQRPPDTGGVPAVPLEDDGYEHFEEYARRALPGLLRYATALTGDAHTGADVVQEVLVRAHGRWERISAVDRPDLYVKKMIANEHLSWRRRWHTRSVVPTEDGALHARAPVGRDPSAAVDDRDDLRQRLAALPRRQRAVLVLRFYEDLDDAEIAEVLGTGLSTVRSNASRALAALRRDGAPASTTPAGTTPARTAPARTTPSEGAR